MPARPEARTRLAALMEERRLELGLRWKQVADAGDISYEVVRAVRNGSSEIRPLSKRGIEVGLRWAPGSVQRILDGGEPEPLSGLTRPDMDDDGIAVRAPILDGADPVRLQPYLEEVLREIRDAVAGHGTAVSGALIFTDPSEVRIWDTSPWSQADRVRAIAEMRMLMDDVLPGRRGRHGREASGQLNARCNKTVTIGNVRDMSLAVRALTS